MWIDPSMVPGFLDISWKALDNQAGLEVPESSGGTAHHERLVLHTSLWDAICCYLEANLWNIPQDFKRIFHLFF